MQFLQVNCLPKIQQANLIKKLRPRSCLELKKNGETQNGFFTVYDNQNNSIPVYCDMTSETHSAWTLVMSWSLRNNELFKAALLTVNTPVNEKTPNWNLYRMTHAQMSSIQSHSTHWRSTCSFNTHAVDYTDYMRGNFRDFNILSYVGTGQCKKVDYINIRSNAATSTTARFWQSVHWMLHVDSSHTGCPFQVLANRGATSSEDNFGFYGAVNPKFRCTASADSTTQYWFGGYE